MNRDPIGEQGGINVYFFVANEVVNTIDMLGFLDWGQLSPDAIEQGILYGEGSCCQEEAWFHLMVIQDVDIEDVQPVEPFFTFILKDYDFLEKGKSISERVKTIRDYYKDHFRWSKGSRYAYLHLSLDLVVEAEIACKKQNSDCSITTKALTKADIKLDGLRYDHGLWWKWGDELPTKWKRAKVIIKGINWADMIGKALPRSDQVIAAVMLSLGGKDALDKMCEQGFTTTE